jgi:hypothetical protein
MYNPGEGDSKNSHNPSDSDVYLDSMYKARAVPAEQNEVWTLNWELICLPLCKSEAALLLPPLETVRYLTESWHVG